MCAVSLLGNASPAPTVEKALEVQQIQSDINAAKEQNERNRTVTEAPKDERLRMKERREERNRKKRDGKKEDVERQKQNDSQETGQSDSHKRIDISV